MAKDAIEFIARERGPDDYPALTTEVASRYKKAFYDAMKKLLPSGSWFFDYDGSEKWYIMPEYIQTATDLALAHFDVVWVTHGAERRNFKTGDIIEERTLF
jgi:hypothetical protein